MTKTDDHSHNVNHHLSCGNSFFLGRGGEVVETFDPIFGKVELVVGVQVVDLDETDIVHFIGFPFCEFERGIVDLHISLPSRPFRNRIRLINVYCPCERVAETRTSDTETPETGQRAQRQQTHSSSVGFCGMAFPSHRFPGRSSLNMIARYGFHAGEPS